MRHGLEVSKMQFFILNANKKNIGRLDTEYGVNPIYDDVFKQYLATGAYDLEFNILLEDAIYAELLKEQNYLLFYWNDKLKLTQIENIKDTETIDGVYRNVYAVSCSLELYQNQIRPTTLEGSVATCLSAVLQDTNFKVGNISKTIEEKTGILKLTSITPVYTVLQQLITVFDIELDFRVEVVDQYAGKYKFFVDVYANGELGNKTCQRIEYDWNEFGMSKSTNTSEFYSGLIAQC